MYARRPRVGVSHVVDLCVCRLCVCVAGVRGIARSDVVRTIEDKSSFVRADAVLTAERALSKEESTARLSRVLSASRYEGVERKGG